MNAFTVALTVLIAASVLWIASAATLAPAKPLVMKATPAKKPELVIPCSEEEARVCRMRKRLEKVGPKWT